MLKSGTQRLLVIAGDFWCCFGWELCTLELDDFDGIEYHLTMELIMRFLRVLWGVV